MIIDCFHFFNEIDLLELRLAEHSKFVDYFLIYESRQTYTGNYKDLYLPVDKYINSKYNIILTRIPETNLTNAWEIEKYQRDYVKKQLLQNGNDDVILYSDLDEIINYKQFKKYQDSTNNFENGLYTLEMNLYYYYLNLYGGKWVSGNIFRVKELVGKSMFDIRFNYQKHTYPSTMLYDMGWHFSWMGGVDKIKLKAQSIADSDRILCKLDTDEKIKQLLLERKTFWEGNSLDILDIDDLYPEYLVNNKERFKNMIYE